MTLDLGCRLRISPDVMFQIVGSEAVLLDLTSEQYFGLNEVGVRIWQLLGEHGALSDVLSRLREEYNIDPDRLRQDLLELSTSLEEAGLVSIVDGDPAGEA